MSLKEACQNGQIDIVKRILDEDEYVLKTDAIKISCMMGHLEIVKLLVGSDGFSINGLYDSCSLNKIEVFIFLFDNYLKYYEDDSHGSEILTPFVSDDGPEVINNILLRCAVNGNLELFKIIRDKIYRFEDNEKITVNYGACLEHACLYGHLEFVKYVIKYTDCHYNKDNLIRCCLTGPSNDIIQFVFKYFDINDYIPEVSVHPNCINFVARYKYRHSRKDIIEIKNYLFSKKYYSLSEGYKDHLNLLFENQTQSIEQLKLNLDISREILDYL